MTQVPSDYAVAIRRYAPLADAEAHKYGVTGAQLLAGLADVESTFTHNLGLTSGAGAKGPTQFMPRTRADFIKKYGVDPWASVDEAIHASALFMRDEGLGRYNPGGGQKYVNDVLTAGKSAALPAGGTPGLDALAAASPGAQTSAFSAPTQGGGFLDGLGQSALSGLLWVVLVLGGAALAYVGVGRASGLHGPLGAPL